MSLTADDKIICAHCHKPFAPDESYNWTIHSKVADPFDFWTCKDCLNKILVKAFKIVEKGGKNA